MARVLAALLFIAHYAAALRLPSAQPHSRTGQATMFKGASVAALPGCDSCLILDNEEICGVYGESSRAETTWFACSGPSDDPAVTCFLAPSWMGLADGQWVCVSNLGSELSAAPTFGEDSY